MPSRSSRYEPRFDEPYSASKDAYPDPYASSRNDGYDYVGSDAPADPPAYSVDDDKPRRARTFEPETYKDNRANDRYDPDEWYRPGRASTQPPRERRQSPKEKSRRADSPPARSRRHDWDDEPRERSKRDESPPPRRSRREDPPPPADDFDRSSRRHRDDSTSSPRKHRKTSRRHESSPPKQSPTQGAARQRWDGFVNKPAVQNMKTYGRKGLSTLGEVVDAYAAAHAPPAERGSSLDRSGRYRDDDRRDYHREDDYRRRRGESPPRAASPYAAAAAAAAGLAASAFAAKRGDRDRKTRPPMNGRVKSYSMSPAPDRRRHRDDDHDGYARDRNRDRERGHDRDRDRDHVTGRDRDRDRDIDRDHDRDRGISIGDRRRRHRSPSPSASPPNRRGRSHGGSERRHRSSTAGGGRRSSTAHAPKPIRQAYDLGHHTKEHLKSPKPDVAFRWQMAARAALEAGGVTAFRLRKEPGSWAGPKGARVASAALGAAAIDAFIDKDPRRTKEGGIKGMAESAIGGLIASKLVGFKSATNHKGEARYA